MVTLIENVIIGNQIIVRSSSAADSAMLIEFLKRLLPAECCETRLFSDFYLETYECNFLGLPPFVEIPEHVSTSTTFIIGKFHHRIASRRLSYADIEENSKFKLTGEDRHTSKLARELAAVLRSELYQYSFQLLIEQIQSTVANWRR